MLFPSISVIKLFFNECEIILTQAFVLAEDGRCFLVLSDLGSGVGRVGQNISIGWVGLGDFISISPG